MIAVSPPMSLVNVEPDSKEPSDDVADADDSRRTVGDKCA